MRPACLLAALALTHAAVANDPPVAPPDPELLEFLGEISGEDPYLVEFMASRAGKRALKDAAAAAEDQARDDEDE